VLTQFLYIAFQAGAAPWNGLTSAIYLFAMAEPVEAIAIYLPLANNKAGASTSSATAYITVAKVCDRLQGYVLKQFFYIAFQAGAVPWNGLMTAIYFFAVAEPVEAIAIYLPSANNKAGALTSSATAIVIVAKVCDRLQGYVLTRFLYTAFQAGAAPWNGLTSAIYFFAVAEPVEATAIYLPLANKKAAFWLRSTTAYYSQQNHSARIQKTIANK
jgi:hypothetical protein